jgi:hypothetical protein
MRSIEQVEVDRRQAENLDVAFENPSSGFLELGCDGLCSGSPNNALRLNENVTALIALRQCEIQVSVLATSFGNLGTNPDGAGEAFINDPLHSPEEFRQGNALLVFLRRSRLWIGGLSQYSLREPPIEVFEIGAGRSVSCPIFGVSLSPEDLGLILLGVGNIEVNASIEVH